MRVAHACLVLLMFLVGLFAVPLVYAMTDGGDEQAVIKIKSLRTDAGVIVDAAPIIDPRKVEQRHAADIEAERSTALAGVVLISIVMFVFGRASVRVVP